MISQVSGNMMYKITLILWLNVFFYFFDPVCCGKYFRLGRSHNGNLGAPGGYIEDELPPAQWFSQKLDHFNPTDQRMWKQRYFINQSFYDFKSPGPVFLMVGGEGPADARWLIKGAWIEYAKKFKALCINLEHRYYGESHPTDDLSIKNLQYLSSSQSLADLAYFITSMNYKYRLDEKVRWVAFGGSYPGSLAAWLRLKYPHLVHAAVSSSGPLLAKVNFMEYFSAVLDALREKTGDEECVQQVRTAHTQIVNLLSLKPEEIEKQFKVCSPFANATSNDIKNFYNSLADDFADLVQYNEDNRLSADGRYRNMTINSVCQMLCAREDAGAAYERLAKFHSLMLQKNNQSCLDYSYDNMIRELTAVKWNSAAGGGRQWFYQTCTEFGFYQTSSAESEVFGDQFGLEFFIQQCEDVFGSKYSEAMVERGVAWTNDQYGALAIPSARVVYVHGSVDPWHRLGICATKEQSSPAIYIHGTAHCANMYPPSETDPSELTEARLEIQQYLDSWLSQ